jgi:hypothetical protein
MPPRNACALPHLKPVSVPECSMYLVKCMVLDVSFVNAEARIEKVRIENGIHVVKP